MYTAYTVQKFSGIISRVWKCKGTMDVRDVMYLAKMYVIVCYILGYKVHFTLLCAIMFGLNKAW